MVDQPKLDAVFGSDGIHNVFHPIVACRNDLRVHGFEALMRGPRGFPFEGPMLAFAMAKSLQVLEELDLRCIETAAITGPKTRLFLNLHPTTAVSVDPKHLLELVSAAGRRSADVVLEIIEHQAGRESELIRATADLREAGFKIAIDDFGEGASNLRRLLRMDPDYIKIDRWFVQGCERDAGRRAVLKAVAQLGRDLGIDVIAEGLDNRAQLDVVRELGIELVQGWALHELLGDVGAGIDPSLPHRKPVDPSRLATPVISRIDDYDDRHLDSLPFGVIQLTPEGTILQYNRYEENLAGLKASRVVGKNFFTDVAPCTDVQEFAGRFREGVAAGRLHTSFDFVFTFKPPKTVRVTLYLSAATQTIWVFVAEPPKFAKDECRDDVRDRVE